MMQSSGESQYAPMNERNGGQVRYLAAGIPPVQKARREDAYKQMFEKCDGRYRIVSESSESAGSITTGQAHAYGNNAYGSAVTVNGSWRYIDFECGAAPSRPDEPAYLSEVDASPVRLAAMDTPGEAPPPKRLYSDTALQGRIGERVNCPAERVNVQKAVWISAERVGYKVEACGTNFACADDAGAMTCNDRGPVAVAR